MADNISMTTQQFEQMMIRLATELRKPPVDPIKEKQAQRQKEMRDSGNAEMWKRKAEKKKICQHSRPDGSCVIAWATQSDNNIRGYCPHCDSVFSIAEDGKEEFLKQYNRPKGMMESVRVVA
jgi:hypothetical protein